jgi:ABC-type dipeptide/oligopeptide/nickel transport system permease subunit
MAGLDWRWIGIGTLIMLGLSLVAGLLILPLLGAPALAPADSAGASQGAPSYGGGLRLLLAAVLSFLSFAVGGFIVGARSAGRTVVEPAISAAIAVALSLLIGGAFTLGNLLAGGVVPFLAGLLGGWLGERRQRGTSATRLL